VSGFAFPLHDAGGEGDPQLLSTALIAGAGALVLGVWGIRAVLLGTNVPGFTAIDLSLAVVILFLLGAITARVLISLSRRPA
jgi:hypothetical protein